MSSQVQWYVVLVGDRHTMLRAARRRGADAADEASLVARWYDAAITTHPDDEDEGYTRVDVPVHSFAEAQHLNNLVAAQRPAEPTNPHDYLSDDTRPVARIVGFEVRITGEGVVAHSGLAQNYGDEGKPWVRIDTEPINIGSEDRSRLEAAKRQIELVMNGGKENPDA